MEQITRTPEQLVAVLRRFRKKRGLSQEALGRQIHMRQATISAIENSATDMRLGTLLDTLAALDLELVVRPRSKGTAQEIEEVF